MLPFDAFMTQRQLAARGRPVRAQMHRLNGWAKLSLAVVLAGEIACVILAGTAGNRITFAVAVVGLVLTHIASYIVESRPGSLKPRRAPPA